MALGDKKLIYKKRSKVKIGTTNEMKYRTMFDHKIKESRRKRSIQMSE